MHSTADRIWRCPACASFHGAYANAAPAHASPSAGPQFAREQECAEEREREGEDDDHVVDDQRRVGAARRRRPAGA